MTKAKALSCPSCGVPDFFQLTRKTLAVECRACGNIFAPNMAKLKRYNRIQKMKKAARNLIRVNTWRLRLRLWNFLVRKQDPACILPPRLVICHWLLWPIGSFRYWLKQQEPIHPLTHSYKVGDFLIAVEAIEKLKQGTNATVMLKRQGHRIYVLRP